MNHFKPFLLALMFYSFISFGQCDGYVKLIKNDVKQSDVIAIVQLDEGKVDGNWALRIKNTNLNKEIDLEKRHLTRYELKLRGKLIKELKGSPQVTHDKKRTVQLIDELKIIDTGPEVVFNILMEHIGHCRDGTLINPSESIHDLIIGNQYFILIEKKEQNHIYYKNIWAIGSKEANIIVKMLSSSIHP